MKNYINLRNLPNIISLLRMFGGIFVLILWFRQYYILSFYLTLIFGVSDYLDGSLSRRLNIDSDLGSKIDPLADKAFIITILTGLYFTEDIVLYFIILIWIRNISQILCYPLLNSILKINFKVKPKYYSKIATTIIFVLILLMQIQRAFNLDIQHIIYYLSIVCSMFEVYILIDYFWQTILIITKKSNTYV